MEKKAEFDLEKIFKLVMETSYDELNYDCYSKKLSPKDKKKVVELLLNDIYIHENSKIDYKKKADKILDKYYESKIIGNDFIQEIVDLSGLTTEEQEWVSNIYDVNYVHLLYIKNNIRVVVRLTYQISYNVYWSVDIIDFINDEELTNKEKYQVYRDVSDMLLNEV